MSDFVEADFEKIAHDALKHAQFGFSTAPLSVNQYLVPVIVRPPQGSPYPKMEMSWAAQAYKTTLSKLIWAQRHRVDSPAYQWQCHEREYSFWVILRAGNRKCEAIDADNCHKMIQDVFVSQGIIPDDKFCRDIRQLYGNFERAGIPDNFRFCVFIRWGKKLARPALKIERATPTTQILKG